MPARAGAALASRVSTATLVPQTRGELEGDEALETLRETGRRKLLVDSVMRFRAADGSATRARSRSRRR